MFDAQKKLFSVCAFLKVYYTEALKWLQTCTTVCTLTPATYAAKSL